MLYSVSLAVHVFSAVVWVGGMFFAYLCLRPVLAGLEPPIRLKIWVGVFRKFFPWVTLAIGLLFLSGFTLIYTLGGFGRVGYHVWAMLAIAVIMTGIYKFLLLAPFRHLCQGVEQENYPVAGYALATIRRLVATNLVLGLLVICLATALPAWLV